jgi:TatD DNase family protein
MREALPNGALGFVDTHVHLDTLCDRVRVGSYQGLVTKLHGFHARYEGCVGIFSDPGSLSPSFGLWPDHLAQPGVYGAFGCHPLHAAHYDDRMQQRIEECLKHECAVAWGEIGLDYSHLKFASKEQQQRCLVAQIRAAVACGKPVIIHSRDAGRSWRRERDLLIV